MYKVRVETVFSAAHALMIRGQREPLHGHDWRVRVELAGPTLDQDGLLVDFHAVESALREVTGPWNNRNLNELRPFADGVNPSAENVAHSIAEAMRDRCRGLLARGVTLDCVSVTEAPGCSAAFRFGPTGPSSAGREQ